MWSNDTDVSPGFLPFGLLTVEEPDPRPLVGLTGLGTSVGSGGGGGTCLVVGTGGGDVAAGCLGAAGLTTGAEGMTLVLVRESTDGM